MSTVAASFRSALSRLVGGLRSRSAVSLLVISCSSLAALSPRAQADLLLVSAQKAANVDENGDESNVREAESQTWIGADRSRYDEGDARTILYRGDLGQLFLVDHRDRTYSELPLPVRIEDYLTPRQRDALAAATELSKPQVELESGTKEQVFRDWKVRERTVVVVAPGMDQRIEIRQLVTSDLEIDLEPYQELFLNFWELDIGHRLWIQHLLDPGGYPAYQEKTFFLPSHTLRQTTELRSVREVEPEPELYTVPAEYRCVPAALPGQQLRME